MLYKLGRFLQVVGMIMLPLAVAGNLVPDAPVDLRKLLLLTFIGVVLFSVGYWLQQVGKAR